jgi:hypothetical protein
MEDLRDRFSVKLSSATDAAFSSVRLAVAALPAVGTAQDLGPISAAGSLGEPLLRTTWASRPTET